MGRTRAFCTRVCSLFFFSSSSLSLFSLLLLSLSSCLFRWYSTQTLTILCQARLLQAQPGIPGHRHGGVGVVGGVGWGCVGSGVSGGVCVGVMAWAHLAHTTNITGGQHQYHHRMNGRITYHHELIRQQCQGTHAHHSNLQRRGTGARVVTVEW